jgi:hypothetical protein
MTLAMKIKKTVVDVSFISLKRVRTTWVLEVV